MNVYLAWTFTVLYYTIYPFAKILQWILIALTPVWHGIEFGLLPLVYLGRFILDTLYLPFAVLGRFETVYIYLGIAGLVGLATGGVLHYSASFLNSLLRLESTGADSEGRTAASYRKEKQKKRMAGVASPLSFDALSRGTSPPYRRGRLPQTILEEEDSEF